VARKPLVSLCSVIQVVTTREVQLVGCITCLEEASYLCVISGFCHDVNEIFSLLGCYIPSSMAKQFKKNLDCLAFEDGTDRLSQK
jgi:hypothetical protein